MDNLNIIDESGDKKYFTIIPNYILNHSTLWDREVYIQMKKISGENGTCWTSQKTLSKQCGMSINRLKQSIKYLLDHKWIVLIGTKKVMTKGGEQEINEYKVVDLWKMNMDFYETKGVSPNDIPMSKGVSRKSQRGVTDEDKGVSPNDYKEEPYEEEPIKEERVKIPYPPKGFQKPTLEEIKDYCKERNNGIDAETFYSFYESKGWKVGNTRMTSWKASIITWEKRNKKDDKKTEGTPYVTIDGKDRLVSTDMRTYSFNGDYVSLTKEQKQQIFYK